MFIERLEIDKEKIIIGWGDLCNFASWVFDNWSWGLFIAVLSLWFTAKSLKKTSEANELAGRSLLAAQESITTSVDLYKQQKRDNEIKKENENKDKLDAIKLLLREEVKDNYLLFINAYKVINYFNEKQIEGVLIEKFDNDYFIQFPDGLNAMFREHSYNNINRYMFDVIILDKDLSKKMIGLKISGMIYKTVSDSFISFVMNKHNDAAINLINTYFDKIRQYKREMESFYDICSDKDTRALSDYEHRLSQL
ncbi:TPA: hypothetical protein ON439_002225 [Morganella morganii]|nr:hypothetical protein [Morganella morganii]